MAEKPKATKGGTVPTTPKVEQTAVVALDWSAAGVTGFENVQARDLGIPFLIIVQSGSPEIKTGDPRHAQMKIPGAVEGSVINTVSRKILHQPGGPPLEVIPLYWDKLYVEWKPRQGTSGGGLVASHRDESLLSKCRKNEKGLDILPNGNVLVTTAYFYVLYKDDEGEEFKQAIIGMSSTQLRASRSWLNISQSIKVQLPDGRKVTPPLFSHRYLLTSTPQNNDKGSWMGWKVEVGEVLSDPNEADDVIAMVRQAKEFAQLNAPIDRTSEPDEVI